jgi:hypothetical protein
MEESLDGWAIGVCVSILLGCVVVAFNRAGTSSRSRIAFSLGWAMVVLGANLLVAVLVGRRSLEDGRFLSDPPVLSSLTILDASALGVLAVFKLGCAVFERIRF